MADFFRFVKGVGGRGNLPTFPTRRSSDLAMPADAKPGKTTILKTLAGDLFAALTSATGALGLIVLVVKYLSEGKWQDALRSEEHTSELQSRLHLVCRLLLEKKKTTT